MKKCLFSCLSIGVRCSQDGLAHQIKRTVLPHDRAGTTKEEEEQRAFVNPYSCGII